MSDWHAGSHCDTAMEDHTFVVEHSPFPAGRGTDVYCCGLCGVILARCLAGDPLEHSSITCRLCGTHNHAEWEWQPSASCPLAEAPGSRTSSGQP